ncbi:TPA: hypothetical protein ACH3X2_011906 [Trebouxia sp. C0005]
MSSLVDLLSTKLVACLKYAPHDTVLQTCKQGGVPSCEQVKETWKRQRNVELCDMAAKDASQFWRDLQTLRSNACPLKLTAQFGGSRLQWELIPDGSPAANCQVYLLLAFGKCMHRS